MDIALQVYHQYGSVINILRMLGDPTRRALSTWMENKGVPKPLRTALDNTNTAAHPCNPPVEVKLDAIHRCFELGERIQLVSEAIGSTRTSLYSYSWQNKDLSGGAEVLMYWCNDKNIEPNVLTEDSAASAPELAASTDPFRDIQMKRDLLQETIHLLTKTPAPIKPL